MVRFLSAIQRDVASLSGKMTDEIVLMFAQQEATLLHKVEHK